MSTRSTNRSADGSFNGSFNRSSSRSSSYNSSYNFRPNFRTNSSYPSNNENNQNHQNYNRDNNRNRGYQQNARYDQRNNGFQNSYENNQDRNRFDNRRKTTKYQHYMNQQRTQVIFEYTNQNPIGLMQTVRNFINFMKINPSSREQFITNKISPCSFNIEVNESEIHASSLEQVQQIINKDTDLVFDALVVADYINEIDCSDSTSQQNA